jgi:phosphoribosylanthranilate isomerase
VSELSSLGDFGADAVLMDTYSASDFGGTGETFDWQIARKGREGVDQLILAGGLTPENVAEAIKIVRPYAVDVASGVESSPGKKDRKKMEAFIKNAKNA